jgi:hypothetical protein
MVIRTALLTIMILLPSWAQGAQWSPEEALTDHLRDNYPWERVEIKKLKLSRQLPGGPPRAITVEDAPPGRTVFRMVFGGGRVVRASSMVVAYDRVVMSKRAFRMFTLYSRMCERYPEGP